MRKKFAYSLTIIILLIVIAITGWQLHRSQAAKNYVQKPVPTLFFHGWGSSANAETKMTGAAKRAGVTNTIVRANVSRHGKVSFNKRIPAGAKNPIVEVNLQDNKLASVQPDSHGSFANAYPAGAKYVTDVVKALEKQHHYRAINFVGHSMGNLEIIYYIKEHAKQIKQGKLPRIDHYVAIAGHFNGILGFPPDDKPNAIKLNHKTGKPNKMAPEYKALLPLRQTFPRHTKVLNIFGNLENGSNSDEDVPVSSARSLRYLLNGHAKSYRELEIKGKNAQHSKLHDNSQVNAALIKFIWGK